MLSLFGHQIFCGSTWILFGKKRTKMALLTLKVADPCTRGWTTSDFLKSTFMWWKSSRSRLVADDVINELISLELWQTPCAQLWNMTQRCPHDICTYNSLFLSLGRYISHRLLLVLNQIQISSTGKITFIWMHALVRVVAWVNEFYLAASLY